MKLRRTMLFIAAMATLLGVIPTAQAAPTFYQHRNVIVVTAADMTAAALAEARAQSPGGLAFDAMPGGTLTGQEENVSTAVGMSGGRARASLLEAAQRQGLSIGVIAPDPFAPHAAVRADLTVGHLDASDREGLSAQMAALGVDVVMGASVALASEERGDEKDLREIFKRSATKAVVTGQAMRETFEGKLWGLFPPGGVPALAAQAQKAVDLLSKNARGFMLSIEAPAGTAGEILAMDDALAVLQAWARQDGKTLILVVPSHSADGVSAYKAYTPYSMPAYPAMSARETADVAASVAGIDRSAATAAMMIDAAFRFEQLGYKVLIDDLDRASVKLIVIKDDERLTLPANADAGTLNGDKKTVGLIAYTGSRFYVSQKAIDLLRNPAAVR